MSVESFESFLACTQRLCHQALANLQMATTCMKEPGSPSLNAPRCHAACSPEERIGAVRVFGFEVPARSQQGTKGRCMPISGCACQLCMVEKKVTSRYKLCKKRAFVKGLSMTLIFCQGAEAFLQLGFGFGHFRLLGGRLGRLRSSPGRCGAMAWEALEALEAAAAGSAGVGQQLQAACLHHVQSLRDRLRKKWGELGG